MLFVKTFLRLLELLQFLIEIFDSLDCSAQLVIGFENFTFEISDIVLSLAVVFDASIDVFLELLDLLTKILLS